MVYDTTDIELLIESLEGRLDDERSKVNTDPTYAQAKAGNYKMGHLTIRGLKITIENPKGSYRKGKDKSGKEWKTLMHNDYGYFNLSVGKDGDAVDVFLGPNLKSDKVFPIDQFINGEFDETKVMLGFDSKEEAKAAYLSNYEKDWKGFKYITEVGFDRFKKWLYDGHRQKKPFAKYAWLSESKDIQFDIIQRTNPMLDDYHVGIRSVDNIKTFEEAMAEAKADFDEYGYYSSYPDTPNSVLENALKTGKITVYSSNPIVNGNFVTTSKMCAKDYAGDGKVYTETLPTSDIAWINVEEGQVARINRLNESMSNRVYDEMEDYSHLDLLEEFIRDKESGVTQKRWNLIPFEQYRNVRERFLKEPAMARIPLNLVMSWFDIIVHNTLSISYITDFAGHSSYFPAEDVDYALGREVEDYSDGWKVLEEFGFYDWAKLPDGSDGWSDYGLTPLYNIIGEFSENMEPGDILMLIDRALDVGHSRGNLASAFIEGGSKSCDDITSKSTLNESKKSIRKNDEGKTVPETCECGGKVCVQIHGEPVFICNKCGKYYGTLPFNLSEAKKTNPPRDIFHAVRKGDRDADIDAHGKSIAFRTIKQKSPKAYNRQQEKKVDMDKINESVNEKFSSQKLSQLAKEHGGVKVNRNGGIRDGVSAYKYGNLIDLSKVTDDMLVGEPYSHDDYPMNSEEFNNCVVFNDGTAIKIDKNSDISRPRFHTKQYSGIGDTGDHDKSRDGWVGDGKDAKSAPYNGFSVSDRAGEAQGLRNAMKYNKFAGDEKTLNNLKQQARKMVGENKRTVYLTEAQFKNYCRHLLTEKRKADYVKGLMKEAFDKRYQAEYENALDDLYYGYGYEFWRTHNNRIEDEETARRIWQLAVDKMANEG